MATFFSLAILVIAIILLCKIAVLVYDYYITRKKLSHIPGLFSLPFFGTLEILKQTEEGRMNWFRSLPNKFKDGIFLLWAGSTPIVVLYKPEMFKVILSSTVNIDKSSHYDFFKSWLGTGLITSNDKQWVRDRKLISPTLHFNMLEQFGVTMTEKTEIMVKNLEKMIAGNSGKAIDIIPVMENLSLDIVFDTIMGVNKHTREAKSNYITCLNRLLILIIQRINRPWLWKDWIFNLSPIGQEFKERLSNMHRFTRQVIQEKQSIRKENCKPQNNYDNFEMAARSSKRKALLELLLDLNDNENNLLSDEELRAQIDTFMFATYDTTSSTLAWALFCIGNNLEHQEKLHEEIDHVFQNWQGPATIKQLSQLKYLDRVMKECLRVYPTIPMISRRLKEDVNLGGYTIPRDTSIMMAIILLNYDPAIWPDPHKFDPDRFLPENTRRMHPYAFIPFSAGPRNCIGQRFALLEEKIVLTAILRKWRVKSTQTPAELSLYDTNILRPYCGFIRMHFSPKQ